MSFSRHFTRSVSVHFEIRIGRFVFVICPSSPSVSRFSLLIFYDFMFVPLVNSICGLRCCSPFGKIVICVPTFSRFLGFGCLCVSFFVSRKSFTRGMKWQIVYYELQTGSPREFVPTSALLACPIVSRWLQRVARGPLVLNFLRIAPEMLSWLNLVMINTFWIQPRKICSSFSSLMFCRDLFLFLELSHLKREQTPSSLQSPARRTRGHLVGSEILHCKLLCVVSSK